MSKTFRAFGIPNFRWYAVAALMTNIAMWMQRIDQDWLAVKLTHNGTAVGVTTALQFLPILVVGPFAGMLADHLPKRRVLVATCAAMAMPALLLGAFIMTRTVTVWHIYGCALMLGVASAVDAPARAAYIRELLSKEHLVNGIGLNQVNFHSSRIIGPAIAGFLIAGAGVAAAFLAVGCFFLIAAAVLFGIRPLPPQPDEAQPAHAIPPGLGSALGQLVQQPGLIVVTVLVGAISSFSLNFQVTLTLMATQVFKLPAGGFGGLTSMMAIGSITGALLVARLEKPTYVRVLTTAGLLGIAYLVAVRAENPLEFGLALMPIGLLSNMFMSTSSAVVQLRSDLRLQGRITGLYMAATNALVPAAAVAVGLAADAWSPRLPLGVAGVLCLVGGLTALATLFSLGVVVWNAGRLIDSDGGGRPFGELVSPEPVAAPDV
jgi:MFS family permease